MVEQVVGVDDGDGDRGGADQVRGAEVVEEAPDFVVARFGGEEGVEAGRVREGRDGAAVVGRDGAARVADEEGEVKFGEEGVRDDGRVGGRGAAAVVGGRGGVGCGGGGEGGGDVRGLAVGGEEVVDYVFDKDAFALGGR